jgi:hypothetical protein
MCICVNGCMSKSVYESEYYFLIYSSTHVLIY